MATFHTTSYGALSMFTAVAEEIGNIDSDEMDIHTITLILDGRHGEFNLVVEATDEEMEEHRWTGIAHRYGGVSDFEEVEI